MRKKTIEIFMSPVKLSSSVFIRDEQGLLTSYKVENKKLVDFVSKQENVEEVTISGAKIYTSKFKDQMQKHMDKNCKFTLRSK